MKKTKRLNIRLTEAEFNRLQGYAQQHNLTVSEYVKTCTGLICFANLKDLKITDFGFRTNLDAIVEANARAEYEYEEALKSEECV